MTDVYQLRGRVQLSDGTGVHGLTVEVIDNDHIFDDELGETYTRRDGSFHVTYREGDYAFEELNERNPEIYVRLRDRTRHIVYTMRDTRTFPPDATDELEIVLDEEALADHFAQPVSWEPPTSPVLPQDRVTTIEATINSAFEARSPAVKAALREAGRTPLPRMETFTELVDDAWEVIHGDPAATTRFRQALADLRDLRGDREFTYGGVGRFLSDQWIDTVVTAIEERDVRRDGEEPAVRSDTVRLLCLAAAKLGAGNPERTQRYVGTVLDQLDGYRVINRLAETATNVLAGDVSPGRFEAELDLVRTWWDHNGFEPPRPPRGPPDEWSPPDIHELQRKPFDVLIYEDIWTLKCWLLAERGPLVIGKGEYTITSISPAGACAGTTVTISGHGFESTPGSVLFAGADGKSLAAEVTSWGDTEITAIVPQGVQSGPISLIIPNGTKEICDRFISYNKHPSPASMTTFNGGAPSLSFSFVGQPGACLEPGQTITLGWTASPPGTSLTLTVTRDGTTIHTQSGLAPNGTTTFSIPPSTSAQTLTFELKGVTSCGQTTRTVTRPVNVVPQLSILGMEVTQGVQTFSLAGGARNTLETVAGKDTIVRVYVAADRKGFNNDRVEHVTGQLKLGGVKLAPINGSTPTNPAPAPFITARNQTDLDRQQTNHTLNFRVPAALAQGTKTLEIEVISPEICGKRPTARSSVSWTWHENRAAPVRFIRIRDDRPGGTGQRPSTAQARFTIQRAFDLFPSPPTDIAPARTPLWETDRDFTSDVGLGVLLSDLIINRTFTEWLLPLFDQLSTAQEYWVGLTTPFNRGMALGKTSISAIWQVSDGRGHILRIKTGHELGHNIGFMHVNRGCGSSAPACPSTLVQGLCFYPHPDNGDLQDVPFDPFWNVAIGGSVQDFMSYGCTRWTSEDSWNRLLTTI